MKNKSVSSIARKLTNKNVILLTVTAFALCAWPLVTLAADCTTQTFWSDGAGSWLDGNNWTSDVPTSNTEAQINNGGTAQITNATADHTCALTLGYETAQQSGSVTVDNGRLPIDHEALIGRFGTGIMTIKNGSTVTAQTAVIAAFVQGISASVGTVSVDGGSTTFTISNGLWVGGEQGAAGGTGLMMVTNGGTVTVTTGSIYVWGSGTLAGNGTITTSNATTVNGTVAPTGGGTTLTIRDTLSLTSGATTQCNVTPQDPSTTAQVSVSNGGGTAQVSLGGRLSVTMTGDFSSAPTRFTLLYADSVAVGHITFDSKSITYPTGHCWHPEITYDYTGGHVYVYLDRVLDCN
jgi:T5SS/PEP-CTERM-associated repeat protein